MKAHGLIKHRRIVAGILTILVLSVATPEVGSLENGGIAETALIPDGDPAGMWAEVIRETVRLRLAAVGLPEEALVSVPPPPGDDIRPLLEELEIEGVSLALISEYEIDSNEIVMELALYDVDTGDRLASDRRRGRLDLELDEVILAAVDSVLSFAALRLGLSPEDFERSPETVALQRRQLPPDPPDTPDEPPLGGETTDEVRNTVPSIYLLTGVSPFFPVGASGSYFGLGIRPVINLLFAIPLTTGELGVGFMVEGNRMASEGTLSRGATNLVSAAPEIRYQSADSGTLSVFVRLAAGASFLYFVSDSGEKLQGVIPYTSTGIGAGFLFSKRFGIVADTGFAIYFEGGDPIMGFAPALQAQWRF